MSAITPEPLVQSAAATAVKRRATELGFDLVGIAPATPSMRGDAFRRWLDDGRSGTMRYLHDRVEERIDPGAYLTGAASAICVAKSYHTPLEPPPDTERPLGRIARYALGDDYHDLIKDRLYDLADWLRDTFPGSATRCAVDTAPVLEKDLAARAGLGWIGKNTLLIHPRLGSYVLLGQVLTTLDLPADELITDHCGSCSRCIDACPTGAITAAYQLDARRCISYLTIENRGGDVGFDTGDWLFGCDVCQEVCPWNPRAAVTDDPAMRPRFAAGALDAGDVAGWSPEMFRLALRGSAMKRVKLPVLQANAQKVVANHLVPLR